MIWRSKRLAMISRKKFLRKAWKESSNACCPLQSLWEGKPAPSWREKEGSCTPLIGRYSPKLDNCNSLPWSDNNGMMIWANWRANSVGYSAVVRLRYWPVLVLTPAICWWLPAGWWHAHAIFPMPQMNSQTSNVCANHDRSRKPPWRYNNKNSVWWIVEQPVHPNSWQSWVAQGGRALLMILLTGDIGYTFPAWWSCLEPFATKPGTPCKWDGLRKAGGPWATG